MKKIYKLLVYLFAFLGVLYLTFVIFVQIKITEHCESKELIDLASPDSRFSVISTILSCESKNKINTRKESITIYLRDLSSGVEEIILAGKLKKHRESDIPALIVIEWDTSKSLIISYSEIVQPSLLRKSAQTISVIFNQSKFNAYEKGKDHNSKLEMVRKLVKEKYPNIKGKKLVGPFETEIENDLDFFAHKNEKLLVVHIINNDESMYAVIFIKPDTFETYILKQ